MSSVFHYTDVTGLLGILSSETLFATDYRYLNDLTEGSAIRELLMLILEKEVAEIIPKLAERGLLAGFYEGYGEHGHRLQAEAMYRSLIRVIDLVSPFFVLSFCKHDPQTQEFKHGLLSQWRGYAESGGAAI